MLVQQFSEGTHKIIVLIDKIYVIYISFKKCVIFVAYGKQR